ncbi:MAG: type II toxin-antitoxin system HicB family antitoxin [Lachnospiraceae bacterium]
MKFIYPAIIKKTAEGTYRASFPDLACCEATGDSLDDVIEKANEAAVGWLELELSEDEPVLPPVTDKEDIVLEAGELVRDICANVKFYDGWEE